MTNDFNFDRVLQNFNKIKKTIPVKVANATKNYFVKSFTDQSFDGQAWQEVQRRISGTKANKYAKPASKTRAILVQSGKLRRAVSTSLRLATFDKIEFLIDGGTIPYAKVHNEGNEGTVYKVGFHTRKNQLKIGGKSVKKRINKTTEVKEHYKRGGIPQRRFIGDTKKLREKQVEIIVKEIDTIWQ